MKIPNISAVKLGYHNPLGYPSYAPEPLADPAPAPSCNRDDVTWLTALDGMLTPGAVTPISSRRAYWVTQAQRGTSGDMVWDMLEDWAHDLATAVQRPSVALPLKKTP